MTSLGLLGSFGVRDRLSSESASMASPSSQASLLRAKEYTPEEWESIREPFTRLYQTPNLTLSSIQTMMRQKYGFDATGRQWKRKVKLWNLERNIKSDDSKFIIQKEAQRKHEGKKTGFEVNGREVTEAKLTRIRRKLSKTSPPVNPFLYTPKNIRYFTPRDPPNHNNSSTINHHPAQQRRPSQAHITAFSSHDTHLIECFLCQVITYGTEINIVGLFQEHVLSAHPGHDVLRCLNGYDASSVPGAVRTTQQLPSNGVGYVHGIRTDPFDTVRLGRLCHVEDQGGGNSAGKRPYLTLTHATSCLTLRADPRQDVQFDDHHHDAIAASYPPAAPMSPYAMNSSSLDFGQIDWTITPFGLNGGYQDDIDAFFNQIPFHQDDYPTLEEWQFEDDKDYWKTNEMY